MKKGISLISLIITIIVVIILAAIAIFSGFGSIEYANLAKFTGEFSDYEAAVQNEYIIRKQNYAINGNPKSDKEIFEEMAGGAEGDINPEVAAKIGVGRAFAITNTIKGYAPDKFGRAYITTEGRVYLDPADAFPYNSDDGLKRYASSNIILDGEVAETEPEPEEKTIKNSLKVGDYVSYTPYGSYQFKTTSTGAAGNTSVTANASQTWHVWKNNGDGTVEIVAQAASSGTICFNGELGNTNAINELANYKNIFKSPTIGSDLVTDDDVKLMTKEIWESASASNTEWYMNTFILPYVGSGAQHLLYTKYDDGADKGLYYIAKDGTVNKNSFYNPVMNQYDNTMQQPMNPPKAIVTIGRGLELDLSDATRDGSTSAKAWVLKRAE